MLISSQFLSPRDTSIKNLNNFKEDRKKEGDIKTGNSADLNHRRFRDDEFVKSQKTEKMSC